MVGRYITPFTDFGFKKLFGMEVNKDLLIDFLNTLLHAKGEIKLLTYLPTFRREYEESLKVYRDLINVVDTAIRKGLRKGLKKDWSWEENRE